MSNVIPFERKSKPKDPLKDVVERLAESPTPPLLLEFKATAILEQGEALLKDVVGEQLPPDKVLSYECRWQPPDGTIVRTCDCSCQLFFILPEGHFCAGCGAYQNYDKECK